MSGPWEKYAERAAAELEMYPPDVERVVAFVGPLIEEDTRERMVTAAGAALERDAPTSDMAISPAAIEAQAAELYGAIGGAKSRWPDVAGSVQAHYREIATLGLEAALPHLRQIATKATP